MPLVESTDLRFVARAAVPSAGAATIAGICGATAFGGSKSSGKTFLGQVKSFLRKSPIRQPFE